MVHQALYRTWRPERFAEVIGQDHIVKVLTGQIATAKTAHAYLFSGPRGTGKTSLAKIFARAVNCISRQGSEPCGTCDVCKETTLDSAVDIVEIDAASNNGVDSVRDIRDRVNLLPAVCSYKVYIIDEVHMLSKGAFNALLKTLEEPPSHVIFILATTEPHKLPATIRSRCQRFDFNRIPVGTIVKQLAKVAKAEGYTFEESALKIIARAAEGGMRDALSILDQCTAYGEINAQNVTSALGGGNTQMLLSLTDRITMYDEKGALEQLRAILDAGADTRTLIKDLGDIFRRMMWLCAGAKTEDTDDRLQAQADRFGKNACVRALGLLIQKEYEMRINLRSDIVLETAVMNIMAPEDDAEATASQRLEKLETRLKVLEQQRIAPVPTKQPVQAEAQKKVSLKPDKKPQVGAQKKNESNKAADNLWDQVLKTLKKDAYFVFTHAQNAKEVVSFENMLEIKYDIAYEVSADYLKQPAAGKAIVKTLEEITGNPLSISVVVEKQTKKATVDTNILEMFGTDIEEI